MTGPSLVRVGRVTVKIDQAAARQFSTAQAFILVTDMTRRIYNRGNILTPVDTGNLRAHNNFRVSRRPPGAVGEVFNDADYAAAVHDGSGPYIIRPKHKKALRFVVNGQVVFAKKVRHPGTRGRPWLARAAEELSRQEGWKWEPGQ